MLASRRFLVAAGTASASDLTNYSAQDLSTGEVFVYYYGDPDGSGVSAWTALDQTPTVADTANDPTVLVTDQDNRAINNSIELDYFKNPTFNAATASLTSTAAHFFTDLSAGVWRFHMSRNTDPLSWANATAAAADHVRNGSNTSALASTEQLMALYAVNFGGNTAGEGRQPGGFNEALTLNSGYGLDLSIANESNRPYGWGTSANAAFWSSGVSASGHLVVDLRQAALLDLNNSLQAYAGIVL